MTTTNPRPRRSITAAKAARKAAAPASGSQLIASIERLWAKVQEFALVDGITLPNVVCITGRGTYVSNAGCFVRLAHVRFDGWQEREREGLSHEIFVAGETFAAGAEMVVTAVLHEASHLVNFLKGVQDTTRRGQLHNMEFVKAARLFGMDYLHDRRHKLFGYSHVELTELGKVAWAAEIATLEKEIRATIPSPAPLVKATDDPTDPRMKLPEAGETKTASPRRKRITYRCGGCSVEIGMLPDDFALAEPTCGCGGSFAP